MRVPLVDLQAQYASIKPDMDAAVMRVLHSCAFASGPEVEAFEQTFARFCGKKHCIGVSSGTSAIEIVARALGIGPGDEVIIPGNTFFATAEAISILGARPVFADVDEATALIDPAAIERTITSKTKLVIPVHLYGQMADMPAIMRIAEKLELKVIEDCAQAHGAMLGGKGAGSFGDAATYSFYPGKNLGAYGEAGAVVTDDASITTFARLFRDHGSPVKYEHAIVGRNDRMDGLQGAVLAAKLPHLERWNEQRRAHAKMYRNLLGNHPRIRIVEELPGAQPVYHLFVVRVPQRDRVRTIVNENGIGASVHYPIALHLQEVYASLGYRRGDLPHCEKLCDEILSLPLYPELTAEQIGFVADTLIRTLDAL